MKCHSLASAAAATCNFFEIELIKHGPCLGSDKGWCCLKEMII